GQSEATARMGYLPYKLAKEKLNYIGIAIPNGKFTLEDDEGNLITTSNTKGELIYEGDNVSLGYALKIDDLTKGDDNKGKLKTGDIAIFDEEHLFKIIGRKSRFLKIYGNRVGLDEIQTLLQDQFKIPDIACVGTDDHLVAFITKESLLQNVKDYLAEITKLNPKAFEVRFIKELPRNTSGKLQYKVLNELL
ncbi:MAG: AMP-binding protein, partial [Succinivibrio sp.]|nr:AMP-binding protein [Succinivibrio sp.]